jgi:hypothetical protein
VRRRGTHLLADVLLEIDAQLAHFLVQLLAHKRQPLGERRTARHQPLHQALHAVAAVHPRRAQHSKNLRRQPQDQPELERRVGVRIVDCRVDQEPKLLVQPLVKARPPIGDDHCLAAHRRGSSGPRPPMVTEVLQVLQGTLTKHHGHWD